MSEIVQYWLTTAAEDLVAAQESFLVRVTEYSVKARYPDMDRQFRRQCTWEFCHTELKQIGEFGIWIEQKILS